MHTLIVNSSPYMRRGNTAVILNSFLSGLRESNGRVDLVNLNTLNINPCRGDLACWFRHKGKCIQQDDMTNLLSKLDAADIIVFATPVYCDGVPGQLKTMMDRIVAMGNPFLELRDNHTRHPVPVTLNQKKFVLIASCGLWETDNFSPMILHLQAFCKNLGIQFGGALIRPHAFAMKNHDVNDILQAAKKAAREIVVKNTISDSLLQTVCRPIVPREEYMEMVNNKAKNLIG